MSGFECRILPKVCLAVFCNCFCHASLVYETFIIIKTSLVKNCLKQYVEPSKVFSLFKINFEVYDMYNIL
jgi:hypothetical protein